MLSRTARQAASRIHATKSAIPTTTTTSSSCSYLSSRPTRPLHTTTHPSASHSATDTHPHATHPTTHTSHVNPQVAKYLSDDVNGWFVGEVPGYKGEVLPGGGSRFYASTFAWLFGLCYVGLAVAVTYKEERDPNVWAKEYVLNVEKYRVPDCPDPFPAAEQQ